MINVGAIKEGYVLDHIQAGQALQIYHDMRLDHLKNATIAIITNAESKTMGRKDILKVECPVGTMDLDVLGFLDHNITVNVIKDEKIAEKLPLSIPKEVRNVVTCKNPRCITSIEQELDQVFILTDAKKEVYRCMYCEEKLSSKKIKIK